MKIRTVFLLWAVVAVTSAVTTWLVLTRDTAPTSVQRRADIPHQSPPAQVTKSEPAEDPPSQPLERRSDPPTTVEPTAAPRFVQPALPVEEPVSDPLFDDPVFKEQLGRYALSYVGADPAADEVWAWLIYDPDLSNKVREDLMEDLNENGFSDGNGRRATADDLPLIESRLTLLEEHMPGADEFMLAHLGEAYKDLMNMWVRLNNP